MARLEGEETPPCCPGHGLRAALSAELREDGIDMELHRVIADAKPRGDGFVRQPLGDDAEDREWQHVREALFTPLPDSTYDGDRVTRWVDQPVVLLLGATDDDRA